MSQNSQKTTVPSNQQGGLELPEGSAGNLQVVRPGGGLQGQLPQGQPNQQLGQGIVPPNAVQKPAGNHENIDDIANFFRNRQMVVQGSVGISPVLKFFIFLCFMMGGFIAAWNYIGQFRKATQHLADEYLGISLADYIPGWTKRAKKFERKVDKELAARPVAMTPGTLAHFGPIDSAYLAVVAGNWPLVEKTLQGKCDSLQPKSPCSLKAWYLSYKGMKSPLRAISKFKPEDLKKLSVRDRATFQFALATASEGPQSAKLFQDVLVMVDQDFQFRAMLFDARFKQVLRENRKEELAALIKAAKDISTGSSDISRWRSLQLAAGVGPGTLRAPEERKQVISKQIQETLKKHAGSFKSDPQAFISIANAGLLVGLSRLVGSVGGPLADESLKQPMDPSIRRELFVLTARSLMVSGDSAAAAQRLQTSKAKDGVDGVSAHLHGSILLEMRSNGRLPEAIAAFQAAAKIRNSWQSRLGLLLAYVRAGNMKEAGRVATNLMTFRTKENADWIDFAMAEYKLALAKADDQSDTKERLQQIAESMAPLYRKHPDWTGLAKVYVEALMASGQSGEAQKVRMSMDDTSSKTSYLSSVEFMTSPIGPFGLMR